MKTTNFIVFNKGNIRRFLQDLGFRVHKYRGNDCIYHSKPHKGRVCCAACKKKLHTGIVGTIAPGYGNTRLVYCDNPACFATWVERHKT